MFLVCFPNPENSTVTLYSPAGRARMEYSPLSEVSAERENPVATFEAVTGALATLPPEASIIFPDSVALTAWLRAEFGKIDNIAEQNGQKNLEQIIPFPAHYSAPPKFNLSNRALRAAF